jgi:dTDP-4-amino-4,6-dideoxygalactose transaminase
MNIPMIDLKGQFAAVKTEVFRNIREILSEQRLILGKYGVELERTIAEYTGVPHAIACANGTDALMLCLMALGIKEGDEVVTTPYTFFSTASSIALVGARPVFADIEPKDMNIDPAAIEKAITPRTKAVIVVHLFGKLCQMDRICDIGRRHAIPVVEDMAQSLGSRKGGTASGGFGDIAAVSFYPTKNLGGIGEGGMVLTKRTDLAEKVRKLRVHGMGGAQYHHEMVGINSRLDEIKSAALVAKFPHLDQWNLKRLENARYYNERFKALPLKLPVIDDEGSHIFHHYVIRLEQRDALQLFLKEKGIQTGIYYPVPLHLQTCFSHLGYTRGSFPEAEKATLTSLAIPVYPELKKRELAYVAQSMKEFFTRG